MEQKKTQGKTPSARAQAAGLLLRILKERCTLDEALAAAPLVGNGEDQRFAMALTLTTLQHLGQLDTVIARHLEKPLPAKRLAVMNAVRLGTAQLLVLGTPAHAAVSESVNLVKKGKDAGFSGLVNAVLKKITAENPTLPSPLANVPTWLRARWEKSYGANAVAAMAQLASAKPPLDIHCVEALTLSATRLDTDILRLAPDHPPVEQLPGYHEGAFFVQDIAASYPVRLLGEVRGLRVLDVCAAPGGKTMQMLRAGAQVTALDRSEYRMRRVRENLARMRMEATLITADALVWEPEAPFDAILLDAPCTATGTWRRHPEVVQLVSEADITEMAALQRRFLVRAWRWVKPGGTLVYCVCSLEPEEGEAQAAWFVETHPDARVLPVASTTGIPSAMIAANALRTHPALMQESGGMDGFFAVCLKKHDN